MKEKLENKEVERWEDWEIKDFIGEIRNLRILANAQTVQSNGLKKTIKALEETIQSQRHQQDKKHREEVLNWLEREDTIIFHDDDDDVNWMEEKLKEIINNTNTNEV